MDRCTHEVRAQYWKGIIQACQQRPTGQSVKKWLKENGILEQSYYKWQQKFRRETYELMQTPEHTAPTINEHTVSFAELPVRPDVKNLYSESSPTAVIGTSSLTIAISNEISDELLSRIIQEVSAHA